MALIAAKLKVILVVTSLSPSLSVSVCLSVSLSHSPPPLSLSPPFFPSLISLMVSSTMFTYLLKVLYPLKRIHNYQDDLVHVRVITSSHNGGFSWVIAEYETLVVLQVLS